MYRFDERFLEYLSQESWRTPSTIASYNQFQQLDVDEGYVAQRCEHLVERELIEPIVEGCDMYEITRWGLAYIRGDLDAGHLPRYPV